MRIPPVAILVLFAWLAASPLEAAVVRVASFNIENGPDAPGSTDYAATKSVIRRINADVVAFQEILGPNEMNWRVMAAELGYQHVLFGSEVSTLSGPQPQRLGYFSRFPIASSAIVTSPPGANEMTRLPLRVVVDVPRAAKPLVLWTMHHKADDTNSANTEGNQFRRAVEAHRIVQDINAYRAANPSHDEFVMLGDLNEDIANTQRVSFTNRPATITSFFVLGSDIVPNQIPVRYSVFPDDRYAAAGGGLHRLDLRQQDGATRITRPLSSRTLDYILVSTALRDTPLGEPRGEVYNSQLDASFGGLRKFGLQLTNNESMAASDHLAVFADINMQDAPLPTVSITAPTGSIPINVPTSINATASVTSGTVASVKFYVDGVLLGTDTAAPFTLPWTPRQVGLYQLSAVTTSSAGMTGTAPSSTITVTGSTITDFSPKAGMVGAAVRISGTMLENVTSVEFGGISAQFTHVVAGEVIEAAVPQRALSGPITISGPDGNASSSESFYITAVPEVAAVVVTPSSMTGFAASAGVFSLAQLATVSAAGLSGPLQISAPAGFEVSLNGTNYFPSVLMSAPSRTDAASNYFGDWTNGSNGGRGFKPWLFILGGGMGFASAYLGNPADSEVGGLGSKAFALRAEPTNSGAYAHAIRPLAHPLASGEALRFDWGVNWDADTDSGWQGFEVKSETFPVLSVWLRSFPGRVMLRYGTNEVDTGLEYGTNAMRWTFSQLDARTLGITATARTSSSTVSYSTNIAVAGAVSRLLWFAEQMDSDPRRRAYFDNLEIVPAAPGGGALSLSNVFVRLAATAPSGNAGGTLDFSSSGQLLASIALSGTVVPAVSAYDSWAQSHGLDPQGNGARGADADGDGYSNRLEFAFGKQPNNADASLFEAKTAGGSFTLSYLAREAGVAYSIQRSVDLRNGFLDATNVVSAVSAFQSGVPSGWRRMEVSVPVSSAAFYRIRASED